MSLRAIFSIINLAAVFTAYCDRGDSFIKCYFNFISKIPKFVAYAFDVQFCISSLITN